MRPTRFEFSSRGEGEQFMAENFLLQAAATGDLEGTREALKRQAPEINSSTLLEALNRAALNGQLEVVKLLLENGANVNGQGKNGNTPLNCAIENLNPELIKYLLENGANVNARDESGVTPLHLAIDIEAEHARSLYDNGDLDSSPSIRITNILIDAGADVNAKTQKGETPLSWAANGRHQPAEQLLLRNGGHV